MGLRWECGGHENNMKTHEIGGVNFNLKEWSKSGPTKLSIALGPEGCDRGRWLWQEMERELYWNNSVGII